MKGTRGPVSISTALQRIAELAENDPGLVFTSLNHNLTSELLTLAYKATRKSAAPGVDGVELKTYGENLTENLEGLLDRAKSGRYRAPPVKRVEIPKGNGKMRPIGIPTAEDKVLQRGVKMVLEPIFEADFKPCSYGFRPGRSLHGALDALRGTLRDYGGGWVLEADIQGYFDSIPHGVIREAVKRRVRDGVMIRLIGKWLNAGVMKEGHVEYPEEGTPQGGVISPLLSNIVLHEVLDAWWYDVVKPRLKGEAELIRYADDFVIVFKDEGDARRVHEVLPKRFQAYGLSLHPEKTKLIRFIHPWKGKKEENETFDFLGFTHFWGQTRKKGWAVKATVSKGRFARSLKKIEVWCKKNRHAPISKQHKSLSRKVRGVYNHMGRPGNSIVLGNFYHQVKRRWLFWLRRRSNRSKLTWERVTEWLFNRFPLPPPRIAVRYRSAANP